MPSLTDYSVRFRIQTTSTDQLKPTEKRNSGENQVQRNVDLANFH